MTDTATPDLVADPELVIDDSPEVLDTEAEGLETAAEPEAKAEPEPDPIEELKAKLAEEQKQRQAAQDRARMAEDKATQAEKEAQTGRQQGIDGQISHLTSAIEQIKAQTAVLKRDYKEALQSGDYDKVADIQEKMAEAAAHRSQIEQGKARLEHMKRQPAPVDAAKAVSDPVESLASRLTPKSADWVRKHPEYATSKAKYSDMVAAHEYAVEAGHAADSDAYFAFVEKRLGLGEPEPVKAKAEAPRRAPQAAAPPTRATTSGRLDPKSVRVTEDEMEMARAQGLTRAEIIKAKIVQAEQRA